jgi:hypothetical protein
VEVKPEDGQDEQGSQQRQHLAGKHGEGELHGGYDGHEGRPIGGVNPIRAASARIHTLGHQDGLAFSVSRRHRTGYAVVRWPNHG